MSQPEIIPFTRVNVEVTPTPRVQEVLARFTDDGDVESLRICTGVERFIETERLRSEGSEGDHLRAKIKEINAYIGSKAVRRKLDLNPKVLLREQENGSGRLFLKPRHTESLTRIEASLTEGLRGELGTDKFKGFLYVDFSSHSLTQDAQRRRDAAESFKKDATDSTRWYEMFASGPHILEQDIQIPTHLLPSRDY